MGLYIEDVIRVWEGEVGYLEKATNAYLDDPKANPGSGNWTKYARDMWAAGFYNGNKNGYAWCAVMFDWCVFQACANAAEAKKALCYSGPYGAGCKASVQYYKEAVRYKTGNPKRGDQIFFGNPASHTGIVEKVENGKVYTIEGNADNQVKRRSYAIDNPNINGYGTPRYDGDAAPAPSLDFPFLDVPAGKNYRESVEFCYENGITAGTDETHFSPNQPLTRAQGAVMIERLFRLLNGQG